jgi:hypothetical protein
MLVVGMSKEGSLAMRKEVFVGCFKERRGQGCCRQFSRSLDIKEKDREM